MVLFTSNNQKLARLTGLFAGILVATYITLEAPLSGTSMNPARTFLPFPLSLDGNLDLLHSSTPGNAAGSRGLRAVERQESFVPSCTITATNAASLTVAIEPCEEHKAIKLVTPTDASTSWDNLHD